MRQQQQQQQQATVRPVPPLLQQQQLLLQATANASCSCYVLIRGYVLFCCLLPSSLMLLVSIV
jgi:hypothetical protein